MVLQRWFHKKCCIMKSVFLLDREIILPPYTFRATFFFRSDIIGVVFGPPVND